MYAIATVAVHVRSPAPPPPLLVVPCILRVAGLMEIDIRSRCSKQSFLPRGNILLQDAIPVDRLNIRMLFVHVQRCIYTFFVAQKGPIVLGVNLDINETGENLSVYICIPVLSGFLALLSIPR